MSAPAMYYFLSSPYLFTEMESAVQARLSALRRNAHSHAAALPMPKSITVHRLRKADSHCSSLVDDKGRVLLSTKVARAIADRPLLIYWTDGSKRFGPFSLMQSVSRSLAAPSISAGTPVTPLPPGQRDAHQLCMAMGGSLGLDAHILDDKIEMQALLSSRPTGAPSYIPWTVPFHTRTILGAESPAWRDTVATILSGPPSFPGECIIVKPSDALKQKGIVVLLRHPSKLESLIHHVLTTTRGENNKTHFSGWVVQSFVADPFMVSGLDLGLIVGQSVPAHLQLLTGSVPRTSPSPPPLPKQPSDSPVSPMRKLTRKKTSAPLDVDNLSPRPSTAAVAARPATPVDPSVTNVLGPSSYTHDPLHVRYTPSLEFPSDSNQPVLLTAMFKIHFRVFAIAKHDLDTKMFDIYGCRLFKIYHAAEPSALLTTVRQEGKTTGLATHQHDDPFVLLTAKTNINGATPSIAHSPFMIDVRDESGISFGAGVSNCLAMRIGNDILSPALVDKFLPTFHDIARDTIVTAIEAGGFGSLGMARVGFQVLGFDFLFDSAANAPVLLETNNNVGQGMFPKDLMLAQGMTDVQYATLREYWTTQFRQPFCDGVVGAVIDELYGLPPTAKAAAQPAFVHLASMPQPAATPAPDLYAYSHGVPPAHINKRRAQTSVIPPSPSPSSSPSASPASQITSTTPSSPLRGLRIDVAQPAGGGVSSLLSPSHSASPSSPLKHMLSVRSLVSPPSSSKSPSLSPLTLFHASAPVTLAPSSPEESPVLKAPDVGVSLPPLATLDQLTTPTAAIFSDSANEIQAVPSTVTNEPSSTPAISPPLSSAPQPPRCLPPPSMSLSLQSAPLQPRPPLTIRFTSLLKPSAAPVTVKHHHPSVQNAQEEKESHPPNTVVSRTASMSYVNALMSPAPPTGGVHHKIVIRRQGSAGFQPVAHSQAHLYPAPLRLSATSVIPPSVGSLPVASNPHVLFPKRAFTPNVLSTDAFQQRAPALTAPRPSPSRQRIQATYAASLGRHRARSKSPTHVAPSPSRQPALSASRHAHQRPNSSSHRRSHSSHGTHPLSMTQPPGRLHLGSQFGPRAGSPARSSSGTTPSTPFAYPHAYLPANLSSAV